MTIHQRILIIVLLLVTVSIILVLAHKRRKHLSTISNRNIYVEYQVGLIRLICNIAKNKLEGTGYESLPSGFGMASDFDGACISFINKFNKIAGVTNNPISRVVTLPDPELGFNLVTSFKVDTGVTFTLKGLSTEAMRDGISLMYYLVNVDNPNVRKFFTEELIKIDNALSSKDPSKLFEV